ncbi:MAG: response regulator [Pseudomonadota bacterium]
MSTILMIDDEEVILKMLKMALEAYGHQVETAANGREGVRKFNEGHFDIVITDMVMPDLDGKGVVRHIRESERNGTPIIGISGTPWLLEGEGFNSVLPKPFSIKALLESVHNLALMTAEAV